MKKPCSMSLSNCLRVHGAQEENQDVATCLLCASRKPEENERQNHQKTQARNPSFLKKMAKSTMSTLKLPLSFVRDQTHSLDTSAILEGPSRGKWRVELEGSVQTFNLNFGHGWEKFVVDHGLQIDDLLTFSLSAKSYFEVEVYDGGGCQKTSALDAEVSATAVAGAARLAAEVADAERPAAKIVRAAETVSKAPEGAEIPEVAEAEGPAAEIVRAAETVSKIPEGAEILEVAEAARSEGLDDPDLGDGLIKLAKSDPGGLLPEHRVGGGNVFSTRSATEVEQKRALQAAEALELANPNILMVMSKQNVCKGFLAGEQLRNDSLAMNLVFIVGLGIPRQFAKEWMPSENKDVSIVNKGGHSWPARWISSRGLSAGWRRFSLDNHLEEHDVCVFEVIDQTNCVLLVHIFRVLCQGEDPGLYTPKLTFAKSNKRKSSDGHEAIDTSGEGSPGKSKRSLQVGKQRAYTGAEDQGQKRAGKNAGDEAILRAGSGAVEDRAAGDIAVLEAGSRARDHTGNRASPCTPATPQQLLAPISFGRHSHEADGTLREGSKKKRRRLRRDVRTNNHAAGADAATNSLQRKGKLLGDVTAPPARRKKLAGPSHEDAGTSDNELLMHLIQRAVDQVPSKNKAGNDVRDEAAMRTGSGGADDQVALRAAGRGDQVNYNAAKRIPIPPEQVLALICYDGGEMLGQEWNGYRRAEHPPSARSDFFPDARPINPDDVHEQIVHAPITGPFRGRKLEMRQEYKVVHIYDHRNIELGNHRKIELLTELEGYPGRGSFGSLDRDDDTGFWWVPYDQFGWNLQHCYIG